MSRGAFLAFVMFGEARRRKVASALVFPRSSRDLPIVTPLPATLRARPFYLSEYSPD